jgi:hypothetical protein
MGLHLTRNHANVAFSNKGSHAMQVPTPNAVLPNTFISPDSAYVVADYPYGFTLRCSIRYWIEYKPGKGFRFVSQTTNPKKAGVVWNKPKASTYDRFGAAMYLDDNGQVQWAGLSEYADYAESKRFLDLYQPGIPQAGLQTTLDWVEMKEIYESIMATGENYQIAARKAQIEFFKRHGRGLSK